MYAGCYGVYGLRAAARRQRAAGRRDLSSGAGPDQPTRRQGLRRRRARLDDERRGGRAIGIRHPPHRHAGDAEAWEVIQKAKRKRPAEPKPAKSAKDGSLVEDVVDFLMED